MVWLSNLFNHKNKNTDQSNMSLYDDIDVDLAPSATAAVASSSAPPNSANSTSQSQQQQKTFQANASSIITASTPSAVSKMNLSFLKTQLEAKKALLQNAAAAQKAQTSATTPSVTLPPPGLAQTPQLHQQKLLTPRGTGFKLKPHKAIPLPLDSSGAFAIVPKALKEDKIFLFGEIMIEDEYNPTAPTEYASFKQKREQQRLKEKIAKDIADRLARETAEEDEKRKKGAAIAPPTAFSSDEPTTAADGEEEEDEALPLEKQPKMEQHQPKLIQFGKGVSRGLGVAANIMSRMGYREGQGLGANKQGISRPLEVHRKGRNVGLIVAEERAQTVVTHLADEQGDQPQQFGWTSEQAAPNSNDEQPAVPITELLKSASKIVLLKNMVSPDHLDADFEPELRDEMAKYGQLVNVQIHQVENSSELADDAIRVFLEFSNQAQAIKAVVDLNGRFYGGRRIRAMFYPLKEYTQRRLDQQILP